MLANIGGSVFKDNLYYSARDILVEHGTVLEFNALPLSYTPVMDAMRFELISFLFKR